MPAGPYTKSFYEEMRDGARRSAEVVIPLVLQLVPVRSVVDIGCGDGSWLSTFQKFGVLDILGIDGDYVEQDFLQIPPERFRAVDLAKPFDVGRTFDLAVSLEVAEHLPAESAQTFVASVTRQAPLVLFSAAIPKQGGNHHLNEQWPEYWVKLFQGHGYLPVDFLRRHIWQNDAVEWWYSQNTLLFVRAALLESNASLKAEFERTNPTQLSLVHPKQYLAVEAVVRSQPPPPPSGVKAALRLLLVCLRNAVTERLNSITGKETRTKEESHSSKAAT